MHQERLRVLSISASAFVCMCVCVFDCVYSCLLASEINGQMKGRWQQREGFQALSDGMTLENEMSLVSVAANETVLCIHIGENTHTHTRRRWTETLKRESRKENGA